MDTKNILSRLEKLEEAAGIQTDDFVFKVGGQTLKNGKPWFGPILKSITRQEYQVIPAPPLAAGKN